jgi:HD domain
MKDLGVAARLYVGAVIAAALLVVVAAVFHHAEFTVSWALILGAMYIALESRPVLSMPVSVVLGVGSSFALAAFMIVGPWGAALVGACRALSLSHEDLVKRMFNGAQFALCAFVAGQVYVALDGPVGTLSAADFPRVLWPVLSADLTHCVANAVLVTVVISLSARVRPTEVLTGAILKSAVSYLGYGVFGLLMAVLWVGVKIGPLSALLLLLPLLVARWAFWQFSAEEVAYQSTISALVQAVETKDRYTRGHSERVARASVMIARVIGMREDRLKTLRHAGILHDVGKLGVPTKLLQKTGALTEDEFAAIKLHPVRGLEMLSDIEFLDEAFKGILHHHERVDGTGYPMGLRGTQIPEFARVIAVADAFDSMTSTRSYRGAREVDEAIRELQRCKGTQFDPRMVDALIHALGKETWVRTEVTVDADVSIDPAEAAFVDHDDPTFVVTAREDVP